MRHPGSNPGWYLIRFDGQPFQALVLNGEVLTTRTHVMEDAFHIAMSLHPERSFTIDNGKNEQRYTVDVKVAGDVGSLTSQYMVEPCSEDAQRWIDEFVAIESWQWIGKAFAVDHHYIADLIRGMESDGLNVIGGTS